MAVSLGKRSLCRTKLNSSSAPFATYCPACGPLQITSPAIGQREHGDAPLLWNAGAPGMTWGIGHVNLSGTDGQCARLSLTTSGQQQCAPHEPFTFQESCCNRSQFPVGIDNAVMVPIGAWEAVPAPDALLDCS